MQLFYKIVSVILNKAICTVSLLQSKNISNILKFMKKIVKFAFAIKKY